MCRFTLERNDERSQCEENNSLNVEERIPIFNSLYKYWKSKSTLLMG